MCQHSRRVKSDLPVLCDPMCGSGTFPIEAALLAADTAPGLLRYAPPGENNKRERGSGDRSAQSRRETSNPRPVPNPLRWIDLADTTAPLWEALWNEAVQRDQRTQLKNAGAAPCIYANDIHAGSVDLASQAAENAGVQHMIQFSVKDISHFRPARPVSLYVTNPPWDHRLDGAADAAAKLNNFAYPANFKMRLDDYGAPQVPMWILNGGDTSRSYLPTRPTDALRIRVASTDMTFCNYLVE